VTSEPADAPARPGGPIPGSPSLRPTLVGDGLALRPGRHADVAALHRILCEEAVLEWWVEPEPPEEIAAKLLGESYAVLLVVDVGGTVAGGIEYTEENEPQYRHAGIDIYLSEDFAGRGFGTKAVRLLADYLFDERGHHRITIDPAVANVRAVRCYQKAGFQQVGVMRRYERGPDGTFHDGLLMDLLATDRPLQ
jgi:aminoglycoside 6'-N-acetyltransferase